MKKFLRTLFVSALTLTLAAFAFTGCGTDKSKTIVVGASSTPHAEILAQIKDDLKADGWTLEIKEFDDYVLPNTSLESGDLDANYFQHKPYLDDFNANRGTHLVSVGEIHYEPFGIYGKNVTKADFEATKTGRKIYLPSDGSNCTRALFLLQENGYITLKADAKPTDTLSELDVTDKKGNTLELIEASTVPAQLNNAADGSIAVINGNYALAAGLKIANALAAEKADSSAAQTYANIIAVKKGNENSDKTKALLKALKSQKVIDYINATYNGAVKPSFTL